MQSLRNTKCTSAAWRTEPQPGGWLSDTLPPHYWSIRGLAFKAFSGSGAWRTLAVLAKEGAATDHRHRPSRSPCFTVISQSGGLGLCLALLQRPPWGHLGWQCVRSWGKACLSDSICWQALAGHAWHPDLPWRSWVGGHKLLQQSLHVSPGGSWDASLHP